MQCAKCDREATSLCPYCREQMYCSEKCHKDDWQRHGGDECNEMLAVGCHTCGGWKKKMIDRRRKSTEPNYERIVFISTGWLNGTSHHAVLSINGTYSNKKTAKRFEVEAFVVDRAFDIVKGPIFKETSEKNPVKVVPNTNGGKGASWFTYGQYKVYADDAKDLSNVFIDIDRDLQSQPGGLKEF